MDPYEVLNVSKSSSDEEIKKRYRELAKKYHPDKNANDDGERFLKVKEAYDTINAERSKPKTATSFFFRRPRRAEPCIVEIPLNESDVYYGSTKNVDFEVKVMCEDCNGVGRSSRISYRACPCCSGTGCWMCKGEGRIETPSVCGPCMGSGCVYRKRSFVIKCPKGVDNGFRHVVTNKGAYDTTSRSYADLVFVFTYDSFSDRIKIAGRDVHVDMEIELSELLGGFKRSMSLYDETYVIESAGYLNPSKEHRIFGEGLPGPVDNSSGDLVVHLKVKYDDDTSTLTLISKQKRECCV